MNLRRSFVIYHRTTSQFTSLAFWLWKKIQPKAARPRQTCKIVSSPARKQLEFIRLKNYLYNELCQVHYQNILGV